MELERDEERGEWIDHTNMVCVWRCVADEMWCGAFIRVSTVLRRYEKLILGNCAFFPLHRSIERSPFPFTRARADSSERVMYLSERNTAQLCAV